MGLTEQLEFDNGRDVFIILFLKLTTALLNWVVPSSPFHLVIRPCSVFRYILSECYRGLNPGLPIFFGPIIIVKIGNKDMSWIRKNAKKLNANKCQKIASFGEDDYPLFNLTTSKFFEIMYLTTRKGETVGVYDSLITFVCY